MTREIYMLGHSTLEWERFVRLLEQHQIERLIDVRTVPYSRFPWFGLGFLRRTLPEGMYEHWPTLGGLKRFAEPEVRRALQQLLERSNGHRVCLFCSEANHLRCHRHTVLAPLLIDLGWKVQQISQAGTLIQDCDPQRQLTL